MIAEFDSSSMELLAGIEVMEACGGLKGGGEGEAVRWDSGEGHFEVGKKGFLEAVGAGVGAEFLDP